MHWQQVFGSSNVKAIKYDPENKECWVAFNNNAVYVYSDVGPGIWDELLHSQSKGRFVGIQLKRAHRSRREADYVETSTSGEHSRSSSGSDPEVISGGNKDKDLGYSS